MTAKMSAARKAAFLEALAATGNQTIAAEAAKVSRSWVCQQRAGDPDFRSECAAALRQARERLRAHPERRPPSGWGFLDGEELVVKGSNGRRVQIARARLRQVTPRVEDRFLAVLAATCNVKAACAQAGVSFGAIYAHRKRWPAFARRWDEAIERGSILLQFALVRYACNPFSSTEPTEPPEIRIGPARTPWRQPPRRPAVSIPADQALHSLYMHQYRTDGIGRRPGRRARAPDIEEAISAVVANVETIEKAGALSEGDKARSEHEYARRRRAGQAPFD